MVWVQIATLVLAEFLTRGNGGEVALDPSGATVGEGVRSSEHLRLFSVPVALGGRALDVWLQQGDDANDFGSVVPRFCAEHGRLASCARRDRLAVTLLPVVRAHWREWLEVRAVEEQRSAESNAERIPGVSGDRDPCTAQYLRGVAALFCMQLVIDGTTYNVAVRDGTSGADVARELQRRHGLGSAFVQVVLSALWQRWFDILKRVEQRRGVMFWFYLDARSGSVIDLPHLPLPLPVPVPGGSIGAKNGTCGDTATFRLVPRLRQRVRDKENDADSAGNTGVGQGSGADEESHTNAGGDSSLDALHAVRFHHDEVPHTRAAQLTLQLYGDMNHQGGETYRNLLEILLERFYGNVQPMAVEVPQPSVVVAGAAAEPLARAQEGAGRWQARFAMLTVAVGHDAGAYDPAVVSRGFEAAIASKEAYCAVSGCTFELSTVSSFNSSAYGNRWVEASALQHGMYRKPGHNAAFFQKVKAALATLERSGQGVAGAAAAVEWVFVSDLDTMVLDPENAAPLGVFVPGYRGGSSSNDGSSGAQGYPYHVVLADRKIGFPNSGCWMVRNSAFGRAFLRRWIALETIPWLTNDNGALAFVVLATLFERVAEQAIPDTAARALLRKQLRDYSAQGSLDYTAYSRAMEQLGSPFGKRAHPHIRFLDGGVGGGDDTSSALGAAPGGEQRGRPFCVRWPRGELTSAVDEAMWRRGDFMLHNKWHLEQLVSQIRA